MKNNNIKNKERHNTMLKDNPLLSQLKSNLINDNLVTGTVRATAKAFGFLAVSEEVSYFIPPKEMKKVLHGDKVNAVIEKNGDKESVRIESLVSTNTDTLIGRIKKINNNFFLVPDFFRGDAFFFIIPTKEKLEDGDYIKARLKLHPFKTGKKSAELIEIITHESDPMLAWKYTISKFKLTDTNDVLINNETVQNSASGRTDLRHMDFYTIDSESTRDIDDAIFIEKTKNEFHLHVAIADPTTFIEINSPSEMVMQKRGYTYYLPLNSIKMMPSELSEGICSLLEGEDRLALHCHMVFNLKGELLNYTFSEAIISSKAKLSYTSVTKYLNMDYADSVITKDVGHSLSILEEFHNVQTSKNSDIVKGTFDDNYRFLFDNDKVVGIEREEQGISNDIVAEAMVQANKCCAKLLTEIGQGIFNCNTGFNEKSKNLLNSIVSEYSFKVDLDVLFSNTKESINEYEQLMTQVYLLKDPYLNELFKKLSGRTELQTTTGYHLPVGASYATFTSPIRKFGDFINHRIIKAHLRGKTYKFNDDVIEDLTSCLIKSKRAQNEINSWFYEELFNTDNQKVFEARITAINKNGMQVKIPENSASGFVRIGSFCERSDLDIIEIDEERHTLSLKNHFDYKIGDIINVSIARNENRNLGLIIKNI